MPANLDESFVGAVESFLRPPLDMIKSLADKRFQVGETLLGALLTLAEPLIHVLFKPANPFFDVPETFIYALVQVVPGRPPSAFGERWIPKMESQHHPPATLRLIANATIAGARTAANSPKGAAVRPACRSCR